MKLESLLNEFTSQDLADALLAMGQTAVGSKAERVQRLMAQGTPPVETLDAFLAKAVREVCFKLNLPSGRKAEMIQQLCRLLEEPNEVVPPLAKPSIRPVSRDEAVAVLRTIKVPRRKARDEYEAQDVVQSVLCSHFEDVVFDYNIGGYFGLRIDLDIGDGKVGVEVKLADGLFEAGGAHRLIGQAVYYQRRRYGENLIVAVVGDEQDLRDAGLKETLSFLGSLGISSVTIPTI